MAGRLGGRERRQEKLVLSEDSRSTGIRCPGPPQAPGPTRGKEVKIAIQEACLLLHHVPDTTEPSQPLGPVLFPGYRARVPPRRPEGRHRGAGSFALQEAGIEPLPPPLPARPGQLLLSQGKHSPLGQRPECLARRQPGCSLFLCGPLSPSPGPPRFLSRPGGRLPRSCVWWGGRGED